MYLDPSKEPLHHWHTLCSGTLDPHQDGLCGLIIPCQDLVSVYYGPFKGGLPVLVGYLKAHGTCYLLGNCIYQLDIGSVSRAIPVISVWQVHLLSR